MSPLLTPNLSDLDGFQCVSHTGPNFDRRFRTVQGRVGSVKVVRISTPVSRGSRLTYSVSVPPSLPQGGNSSDSIFLSVSTGLVGLSLIVPLSLSALGTLAGLWVGVVDPWGSGTTRGLAKRSRTTTGLCRTPGSVCSRCRRGTSSTAPTTPSSCSDPDHAGLGLGPPRVPLLTRADGRS